MGSRLAATVICSDLRVGVMGRMRTEQLPSLKAQDDVQDSKTEPDGQVITPKKHRKRMASRSNKVRFQSFHDFNHVLT